MRDATRLLVATLLKVQTLEQVGAGRWPGGSGIPAQDRDERGNGAKRRPGLTSGRLCGTIWQGVHRPYDEFVRRQAPSRAINAIRKAP